MGRTTRLSPDAFPSHAGIVTLIADRLDAVETMFRDNLASPVSIVDEIGSFVAESGGKRVRPTLHLLCSRLCGHRGDKDVLLATVLEFIHCATLIHDDIIDAARTRRGRDSVNHRWGNDVTVLFGDYLFAKAMEMALEAESLPVMRKLAEVTLRMTEGEMLQTRYTGRLDLTLAEYLDLIEKKTAALFGCCCELAAMLSGLDDGLRDSLRRYGLNLGLAFQLVDDLLDFTGDPRTLGKPAASDLREGKATLAVIELIAEGPSEAADLARRVMEQPAGDGSDIARLSEMLQASGAIERSRERARGYARRAVHELEQFPDGPERRALRTLPDLLLERDR